MRKKEIVSLPSNIIKIVMGDYTNDGHGKYDEYYIRSNKSYEDIKIALDESKEKIGIDFREYVEDFEKYDIPSEDLSKFLSKINLKLDCSFFDNILFECPSDDDFDDEGNYYQDFVSLKYNAEGYLNLILLQLNTVNPDLGLTLVHFKISNIDIGGYGLFS